MTVVWTADLVNLLTTMQASGRSANQIAQMIPDATRSAVIGKLHRLGIVGLRAKKRPNYPKVRKSKVLQKSVAPAEKNIYIEPVVVPLSEQKLHSRPYAGLEQGLCHWPLYYEGPVQMYCAGVAMQRKSYCQCHQTMSEQPKRRVGDPPARKFQNRYTVVR
jgi:GcrA cell cycle regulator